MKFRKKNTTATNVKRVIRQHFTDCRRAHYTFVSLNIQIPRRKVRSHQKDENRNKEKQKLHKKEIEKQNKTKQRKCVHNMIMRNARTLKSGAEIQVDMFGEKQQFYVQRKPIAALEEVPFIHFLFLLTPYPH